MCYPLFVSISKFICPKIQIGGELEVIFNYFFFYRPLITLVDSIFRTILYWDQNNIPKCTTLN